MEPEAGLQRIVANSLGPTACGAVGAVAYRAANPPDGAGWFGAGAAARRTTRWHDRRDLGADARGAGRRDNVVDPATAPARGAIAGARLELFEASGT